MLIISLSPYNVHNNMLNEYVVNSLTVLFTICVCIFYFIFSRILYASRRTSNGKKNIFRYINPGRSAMTFMHLVVYTVFSARAVLSDDRLYNTGASVFRIHISSSYIRSIFAGTTKSVKGEKKGGGAMSI